MVFTRLVFGVLTGEKLARQIEVGWGGDGLFLDSECGVSAGVESRLGVDFNLVLVAHRVVVGGVGWGAGG